jgi:hypothetical protein
VFDDLIGHNHWRMRIGLRTFPDLCRDDVALSVTLDSGPRTFIEKQIVGEAGISVKICWIRLTPDKQHILNANALQDNSMSRKRPDQLRTRFMKT